MLHSFAVGLPSPAAHRPAAICLVQAEDRPLLRDRSTSTAISAAVPGVDRATGLAALLATNRALCEADGNCSYVRHDGAYKEIEPHWRKVFIGSMVLNTTRCPAIAWLDSDAVLGGRPSDLLSLLHPPRGAHLEQAEDRRYVWPAGLHPTPLTKPSEIHMVVAGEGDTYNHNLSPMNAGVWIVANTRIGRGLMARWAAVWTETASKHWRRDPQGMHTGQDDLSWKCTQPDERSAAKAAVRTCDFSKEHYEQGAFVRHLLSHPRYKHAIRLVPWRVLQDPHIHPMVHHFIGPPRAKERLLNDYLRFRGPGQEGREPSTYGTATA